MELKWAGIVFVMTGSAGIGFWYRMRCRIRMANLRECQLALSILRGEIQYGKTPLPEACHEVEKRLHGSLKTFFFRLAEEMEKSSKQIEQIWKETTEITLPSMQMGAREREEWIRFGGMLGYLDVEMQLCTIDLYRQRLQVSVDRENDNCHNRLRLYPLLGAFGGMLICLIFV